MIKRALSSKPIKPIIWHLKPPVERLVLDQLFMDHNSLNLAHLSIKCYYIAGQRLGIITIFYVFEISFLYSPSLHLLEQKHSKTVIFLNIITI